MLFEINTFFEPFDELQKATTVLIYYNLKVKAHQKAVKLPQKWGHICDLG